MNQKKITILRSFFRYLAIFLVPIIGFTTLFLYNEVTVNRKTIADYHYGLLTQFSNEVELSLNKIENIALHLSGNEALENFPSLTTVEQSKVISTYENNLYENISLLFFLRRTTNVYFQNEFMPYHVFEKSNAFDIALSKSGLFLQLNNAEMPRIISVDPNNYGNTLYSAAYISPVPMMSASPIGSVAFMIQRRFFDDISEKYYSEITRHLYIMDAKHSILYGNSNLLNQHDLSQFIRKNRLGISTYIVNNDNYVSMRYVSASQGLHFIALIPEGEFYRTGQGISLAFWILVALICIFSIFMAAILAQNLFNRINVMEKKHSVIEIQLHNRNLLIKQMVCNRLINGKIKNGDEKSLAYNLHCSNLVFQYHYFFVIVFILDNLKLTDEDEQILLQSLSLSVEKQYQCYAVRRIEENQVCVIANVCREDFDRQSVCCTLRQIISNLIDGSYETGCGNIYDTPFHVNNSFVEAVVSLQEEMRTEIKGLYMFEDNATMAQGEFAYPYVEQAIIEQSIRSGSAELASSVMRNVFEKIEAIEPSFFIQRCLHFDMINMMAKIAISLGTPLMAHEIAKMSSLEDLSAIRVEIEKCIVVLTQKAAQLKTEQRVTVKQSLIEYVQEHFRENDLSLNVLADQFKLSYTYISKIFKDETGQSFLTYLTQLRFAYIKDLLATSKQPIKDIIIQAGYLDVANFMRKFKLAEGITAGQYRQLYQDNKGSTQ